MGSTPNNRLTLILSRINQYGIRFPVAQIVKETGLNKGYVSAVLKGKKPVSDNFWQTFDEKFPELNAKEDGVMNKKLAEGNGAATAPTILTGSVTLQDHIASIEARRLEAVARAEELKAMYQEVKKEKGVLYDLIKENLTQLLVNSNETLKRLEKVLLFDRADHETIMNAQDRAEHLPPGTSKKVAGNLAVEKAKHLQKKTGRTPRRDDGM
jgi:hypothetical protein